MKEHENRYELYLKNHKGITYSNSAKELYLLMPFDVLGIDEHIILDLKTNEIYLDGFIFEENRHTMEQIKNLRNLCKEAKSKFLKK